MLWHLIKLIWKFIKVQNCEVLFLSSVLNWCILCLCRKENEALVYNLQTEVKLRTADL